MTYEPIADAIAREKAKDPADLLVRVARLEAKVERLLTKQGQYKQRLTEIEKHLGIKAKS